METGLEGSHIFVTGASGGIGLETAKKFLEENAKVTLHYNTNKDSLEPLLEEYPDETCAVRADVREEKEVINSIEKAKKELGPINSIIINHGIWIADEAPVLEMELGQWQKTIDIDLTGSFLFARSYLRQLHHFDETADNISITFIGSTAGKFGEANHADYASAKAALMYGFTRSLKNEIVQIHPRGRVNSVMPGWVLTEMAEETLEGEGVIDKVVKTMALDKIARPKDVAASVLFLTSDKLSGHISGDVMEVAGGMEGRVLR